LHWARGLIASLAAVAVAVAVDVGDILGYACGRCFWMSLFFHNKTGIFGYLNKLTRYVVIIQKLTLI
jgi:hypothetical protein